MIKNEKIEVTKDFWYYDAFQFNKEFKVEYTFPKMRCTWGDEFTTCEFVAQDAPEFTRARIDGRVYFLISKKYINENLYKYALLLDCKSTYKNILAKSTWVQRATFKSLYHESIDTNYPKKYTSHKVEYKTNGYFICVNKGDNDTELTYPKAAGGIIGNYSIIYVSEDDLTTKWYFKLNYIQVAGIKVDLYEFASPENIFVQKNKLETIPVQYIQEVGKDGEYVIEFHFDDSNYTGGKYIDFLQEYAVDGNLQTRNIGVYLRNFKAKVKIQDGNIVSLDRENQANEIDVNLSSQYAGYPFGYTWAITDRSIYTETTTQIDFTRIINDIYKSNNDTITRDILSIQRAYAPVELNTKPITLNGTNYRTVKTLLTFNFVIPKYTDLSTYKLNVLGVGIDFDNKYNKFNEWIYAATLDCLNPTFLLSPLSNIDDPDLRITGNLTVCLPFSITKAQEWTLTNSQTLALHEQSKAELKQQFYTQLAQKAVGQLGNIVGLANPATAAQSALGIASVGTEQVFEGIKLAQNIKNKDTNYRLNYLQATTQPNVLSGTSALTLPNAGMNYIIWTKSAFIDSTMETFIENYGLECNMPFENYTLLSSGFLQLDLLACPLPKPVVDIFRQQLTFWYKT